MLNTAYNGGMPAKRSESRPNVTFTAVSKAVKDILETDAII